MVDINISVRLSNSLNSFIAASNSQASNTSWCYLMVGLVDYIEYVG